MWQANATCGDVETTLDVPFVCESNKCKLCTPNMPDIYLHTIWYCTSVRHFWRLQVAFHTFWAAGCQCTCNSIFQSAYHLCEVYLLILSVQLLLFLRMSPVMVRGSGRVFPLCVMSPLLCRAVLVLSRELHLELINAAAFKSSFDNYLSPERQLTSVSIRRFILLSSCLDSPCFLLSLVLSTDILSTSAQFLSTRSLDLPAQSQP